MLTEKSGSMAFTSSLFLWAWEGRVAFIHITQLQPKKTLQQKSAHHSNRFYLTKGAIGLFVEEFDLICSRAGLFVGKTPGHLAKEK